MTRQVLAPAFIQQLKTVVRRVLRESRNTGGSAGRRDRVGYHQGYVDGAITAGTGPVPVTGYVIVWAEDDSGTWAKQTWPDGTDMRIEIRNRWDTAISDNTYCHIQRVGRHWQIVAASCSAEV